ncbi:zinc finger BED domain-containing protein RICESLEEPER 2-like [Cucumis melo var. makuwa]|uniref:Zinc finger BED domain-containing protein RICESLEEPER 2-like n=1 Tax=Cucumis melo var. makuwa TaxID=1194695 RepID=A0A5A7TEA9_CUCMM|nr:zinc finger BED domain-containing protein RICESLEEPER 2-like [Cucumis melo var. makuwa]TYK01741.1 zinc finger BED domain-containing protein RICESLEEPER 2-like [Cucumis melo var. makuwa]
MMWQFVIGSKNSYSTFVSHPRRPSRPTSFTTFNIATGRSSHSLQRRLLILVVGLFLIVTPSVSSFTVSSSAAFYLRKEEEELDYQDYFAEDEHGKKRIRPPSNSDWKNVEVFVMFFKVFYNVTNKISGSLYVTANSFFHEMWGNNDLLVGWSNEHNSTLRMMAINMKSKYDNVHDDVMVKVLVDEIEAYLMRLYNCYKSQVDGFAFRNDLSGQDVVCEQVESSDSLRLLSSGTTVETNASCRVSSRYKRRRQEQNTLELRNNVDRYLSDPCEELNDQFDVLTWWKLNEVKCRILSRIAQDIFVVPVSTVASESAYSTGGRILDSFRSSLSPKKVEALICT